MSALKYVLIGALPARELAFLRRNLAGSGLCAVRVPHDGGNGAENGMGGFPAEESIFLSGDGEELLAAAGRGMATVGYLGGSGVEPGRPSGDGKPGFCPGGEAMAGRVTRQTKEAERVTRQTKEAERVAWQTKEAECANRQTGEPERVTRQTGEAGRGNVQTKEPGRVGWQADLCAEGFEEVGPLLLRRTFERHHGIPWTILKTERCVVREFSLDDLDALYGLYAGEGMTDYIAPLYGYEQEKEYQRAYIANMYGFYGYGMWLVCDKATGELIGRAGLESREELGGEMELGYAIGVPYQRQGYATEVCRAIIDYAREELGCTRLNCLIEEGNAASEALARGLGFRLKGTMALDGKSMGRYEREL